MTLDTFITIFITMRLRPIGNSENSSRKHVRFRNADGLLYHQYTNESRLQIKENSEAESKGLHHLGQREFVIPKASHRIAARCMKTVSPQRRSNITKSHTIVIAYDVCGVPIISRRIPAVRYHRNCGNGRLRKIHI